MKNFVLCLGLAVGIAPFCLALDQAELEVDHKVRSDFVTPHTTWARPWRVGRNRILFFVNGRGTNAREVVELGQRFDFDSEMIFWGRIVDTRRDAWHGGPAGLARMSRLLERPWDAFVFLDIEPKNMPTEQQYTLLKAVAGGAGLVLLGHDDKRVFKEKNRLAATPSFLADVPGAALYRIRAGRGVRLPKRPNIAFRPGWNVAYDEWDMRLGKAILWAAGSAPRMGLSLTAVDRGIARDTLPRAALRLAWQDAPPKAAVTTTLRRDDDGAVIVTRRRPLAKAAGSLDLHVPMLRAGKYWLDAIARTGDAAVGFASLPFTVTASRGVKEVFLDRDWAEVGEALSGRVTLSGAVAPGDQVLVRLGDRRGRVLARQLVEIGEPAGAAAFSFRVWPWFPMLLEVRAVLLDSGLEEVASAWRFAHVVKRRRGRFNFIMWDVPRGNLAPVAEESLARNGVTVQLAGGTPPDYVAACDIAWIPYTTHIKAKWDKKGMMKPVCWNDEAGLQAEVNRVVEKARGARRHGVFVYSLGDEISVRGSCLGPHCLAAYREYLRAQYGDIAALNASWGSTYADFDQVQLTRADDNDEAEALRQGNFPRWFDRQAFQSYTFCKLCERYGRGFRRIDPKSRCGFEGAGTFKRADDLDGFVRFNTFWSPYPGLADEVLRSIAPRDFPRANWMGYTKDADSLLEKYWRMVTRGCDSVWWWRWEVLGRFHGWLAPCLDPYPAVREILRDTQILRDGLGDLLLHCAMQTDDIGLLYSLPSAYAAKVQASSTFGSYERNHAACQRFIRDQGCNFRYFTDRQLRLGEVELRRFKIVFLPLTQAMSPATAEKFRRYVAGGGMLVADVRPAICDGHVRPLKAGLLDDVFGIRRSGPGTVAAVSSEGALTPALAPAGNGPRERRPLGPVLTDPAVRAAGSTARGAAGETPLMLVHAFGKGTAVLLNLSMASLPAPGREHGDATTALWQAFLERSGTAAPFALVDAAGNPIHNVECTRWTNGPMQIVSVFRHRGVAEPLVLRFSRPFRTYDLKNRRNLGVRREIRLQLTPSRAQFFALSPGGLAPIGLKLGATALTRGEVLRLRFTLPEAGSRRAVKLEVRQPDGTLADWVDPVVIVEPKGTTATVPLAFNDPPGTWTVKISELCTGRMLRRTFRVR